jgi:hypothetical protein
MDSIIYPFYGFLTNPLVSESSPQHTVMFLPVVPITVWLPSMVGVGLVVLRTRAADSLRHGLIALRLHRYTRLAPSRFTRATDTHIVL